MPSFASATQGPGEHRPGIAIDDTKGTGFHDPRAFYDLVATRLNAWKAAGECNHMTITTKEPHVDIVLNGKGASAINLDEFDHPGIRPDGTKHRFSKVAIKEFNRTGLPGVPELQQRLLVQERENQRIEIIVDRGVVMLAGHWEARRPITIGRRASHYKINANSPAPTVAAAIATAPVATAGITAPVATADVAAPVARRTTPVAAITTAVAAMEAAGVGGGGPGMAIAELVIEPVPSDRAAKSAEQAGEEPAATTTAVTRRAITWCAVAAATHLRRTGLTASAAEEAAEHAHADQHGEDHNSDHHQNAQSRRSTPWIWAWRHAPGQGPPSILHRPWRNGRPTGRQSA